MVIDTSALVAILFDEPERPAFRHAIVEAEECFLSATSLVECATLIERRRGSRGSVELDLFIAKAGITVTPFDADQARLARLVYRRFGKGTHSARLNLGDCFSYALAKGLDQPLLFKGQDFPHTDVQCHPASTTITMVNEPAATYAVGGSRLAV